jgi:putative ABC transport system substrate-binding protein
MAAAKLPMIYFIFISTFVSEGGLICYAANYPDLARRSAAYAAKIFGGAKPADLPVEQPVLLDLTINMKAAQALGLLIPPSLLARATEVIE